jgi:uncharacterized protein YcbX
MVIFMAIEEIITELSGDESKNDKVVIIKESVFNLMMARIHRAVKILAFDTNCNVSSENSWQETETDITLYCHTSETPFEVLH